MYEDEPNVVYVSIVGDEPGGYPTTISAKNLALASTDFGSKTICMMQIKSAIKNHDAG